jgi:hypothetical protein
MIQIEHQKFSSLLLGKYSIADYRPSLWWKTKFHLLTNDWTIALVAPLARASTAYLVLGENALGVHGARRALRVRAAGGRVHEAGRERAGHQQHAAETDARARHRSVIADGREAERSDRRKAKTGVETILIKKHISVTKEVSCCLVFLRENNHS